MCVIEGKDRVHTVLKYKQNAFLYIVTSYEKAGEVLPKLHAVFTPPPPLLVNLF